MEEVWYKQGSNELNDILVDSLGNTYLFESNFPNSVILKKCNSNGVIVWTKSCYDTSIHFNLNPHKISFDKAGDIVASFENNFGFVLFLGKYDTNGNNLWFHPFIYNNYYREVYDFEIDPNNNIYVVTAIDTNFILLIESPNGDSLHSSAIADWESSTRVDLEINEQGIISAYILYTNGANSNLQVQLICGYDSLGALTFRDTLENTQNLGSMNSFLLGMDNAGNSIVCSYSGDTLASAIKKYDMNGNLLWSNMNGVQLVRDIEFDSNNNFYLSGYINSSYGIRKLNSFGAILWTYIYPTLSNYSYGYEIKLAKDGSVFCMGFQMDTSGSYIIMIHLNANGNYIDSNKKRIASLNQLGQGHFGLDNFNNVYVNGWWYVINQGPPQTYFQYGFLYKLCNAECVTNITGTKFIDNNINCLLDTGDLLQPHQLIILNPLEIYATSNDSGHYALYADTGNYYIKTLLPRYWTNSCGIDSQFISITSAFPFASVDLGTHLIPHVQDLQMSYGMSPVARPGFTQNHTLLYNNVGTMLVANASLKLRLDTSVFTFLTAIPPPDTILGNEYTWNIPALGVFQNGSISFTTQVKLSAILGTPYVNFATIYPYFPDTVKNDNADTVRGIVRGAFDPNQKLVSTTLHNPNQPFAPEENELAYQIDFQNTGTDTAFTVSIIDTLSNNLDLETIRFGTSSHPYTWNISGPRILKFTFSTILLPDSNTNESKSHGFVKFYIRPKPGLPLTTLISNTATINFDFNSGVRTNTAYYPASLVGIPVLQNKQKTLSFKIYPIPTNGDFTLYYSLISDVDPDITIYDMMGKKMYQKKLDKQKTSDNLYQVKRAQINLQAGIYIVKLVQGNFASQAKLIISKE